MNEQETLLVVEDDADDRELMLQAIQDVNPSIKLVFAENGLKAIEYLEKIQEDKSLLPCLIVLDLNMPYIDGMETYRRIKENATLCSVPVIVFTSSLNPRDRQLFLKDGVEFITKPDHFAVMNDIVAHMLKLCNKSQAR